MGNKNEELLRAILEELKNVRALIEGISSEVQAIATVVTTR